jgi:hypothetical protein
VNCQGSWSSCDPNTGTKTFTITQAPQNGGTACPSPLTQNCPVDCVGSWGSCAGGPPTFKTYTWTTTPKNGGSTATCAYPNGQTDSSGCSTPVCPAQVLAWNVGANACSGAAPSTPAGSSATVMDSTMPTVGGANFNCNADGTWSTLPNPGAACTTITLGHWIHNPGGDACGVQGPRPPSTPPLACNGNPPTGSCFIGSGCYYNTNSLSANSCPGFPGGIGAYLYTCVP